MGAAPTVQSTYSPVQVGASGVMTPEQLRFVFPHGAPANYAPAPPSATVVETQAPASTVIETPAPIMTEEAPVSAKASSKKKDKKSSKKKDKLSSKKKAKG